MIVDTSQITCNKFPYYHLIIKDNAVIGCIKDPSFACEGCNFKKVCLIERSKNAENLKSRSD